MREQKEISETKDSISAAISSFKFRFAEGFEKAVGTTDSIELISFSKWQKDRLAKAA